MRTEPPSPLASALARFRGAGGRVRRWLAARGTITRVALLLVGLATLGAAGYLASINDPGEPALGWMYENRKLSGDDIDKISRALDGAGIPHFADSAGRVGVKRHGCSRPSPPWPRPRRSRIRSTTSTTTRRSATSSRPTKTASAATSIASKGA